MRTRASAAVTAPMSRARGPTGRATTPVRSTGRPRRASRPSAATTSSSSASGTRTRCRVSSSSATGDPRWASTRGDLPWLSKPTAVERIVELLVVSAVNQRGLVGYLDHASHGRQNERAHRSGARRERTADRGRGTSPRSSRPSRGGLDAPPDTVDRASRSSRSSRARSRSAASSSWSPTFSRRRAGELGGDDRPRVGRRRGRRPGPRLGAELPADRRRRDALRRSGRRTRSSTCGSPTRRPPSGGATNERPPRARSSASCSSSASTRSSSRASGGRRPGAFLDWGELRLTTRGLR